MSNAETDAADLVVIGGGVMGLFTAYHASASFDRVVVLERGTVGDPATASYGRTRSYRRDYLDAQYARLADEAMRLWDDFERRTGTSVLVRCGCLNIAAAAVTPDLATTYAQLTTDLMHSIGLPVAELDEAERVTRFPWLAADLAHLDESAGLVDLAAVTGALQRTLAERGVPVRERVAVDGVAADGELLRITTDGGAYLARAVVITAGHGTNDVLERTSGTHLRVPLTRDRPSEAKYLVPPAAERKRYTAEAMPVLAYLDTGVYVHPIVDGVVDAVKIGYYNPPDLPRDRTGIDNIAQFVDTCLPGLRDAAVSDVSDVDQCDYDLVGDDDFVLGAVPGVPNLYVGVGWRGTGYKFAPWVGRVLGELALRRGTVYDITRFDPSRFTSTSSGGNR